MPRICTRSPIAAARLTLAAAATLLGCALFATVIAVHVDNNDAALYSLIARRLASGSAEWMRPTYPAEGLTYPPFREHPPLFFWVQALLMRVAPVLDLRLLGAACGAGTLLATFVAGRALVGVSASFLGTVVLATSPWFFEWQPNARLDPPLTLLFTLSVALLVSSRGKTWRLAAGGLAAGLGVLVKGPPALGAPIAAALALVAMRRFDELRRPRTWLIVSAATLLPAAIFLAYDHLVLDGEWWRGYVNGQFFASISGERRDARSAAYLLRSIGGRFWPGLPFAAVALAAPLFRRPPRRDQQIGQRLGLLLWAAVIVGGYSVASRFYWWYVMPAFPPLALLAGAGLDDLRRRWSAQATLRRLRLAMFVIALVVAVLAPAGVARLWVRSPCAFDGLPERACAAAGPGGRVAIVVSDYTERVVFGEHAQCETVRTDTLQGAREVAGVAVARAVDGGHPATGWAEAERHQGWMLLVAE